MNSAELEQQIKDLEILNARGQELLDDDNYKGDKKQLELHNYFRSLALKACKEKLEVVSQ